MADDLSILFQDPQEPDMPERRVNEVMLALIREVQASVSRTEGAIAKVSDKLDRITDERREEARENGNISARVEALETFREETESRRRSDRGIALGAIFTAVGTLLLILVKIIAKNPEVLK